MAGARRLFCFLQLEKQTRSNISLVLKPRKDSQGFMQRLLRASHSASMLRYSRGAKMLEWFFVLRALTASEMRFLSENDVRYALVKENGL